MKLKIRTMIWHIRKQKHPMRTTKRKKNKKNEDGVRNFCDNFKCIKIHIMEVPEEEEREQEIENLFEKIMTENFPNLVKERDIQVQEVQRTHKKMNSKRPTPRHIIIKMQMLKTKRESKRKTVNYLQGSFHKSVC